MASGRAIVMLLAALTLSAPASGQRNDAAVATAADLVQDFLADLRRADLGTAPVLVLPGDWPAEAGPLNPQIAALLLATRGAYAVNARVSTQLRAIAEAGQDHALPQGLAADASAVASASPRSNGPSGTPEVRLTDIRAAAALQEALGRGGDWLPRLSGPVLVRVVLQSVPEGATLHIGPRRTPARAEAVRYLQRDDFFRGRLVLEGFPPCALYPPGPAAAQLEAGPDGVVARCEFRLQ